MNVYYSSTFRKDYQDLPGEARTLAEKQLALLAENPRHPSLRVRKIRGTSWPRWEGRITRGYRFTFDWEGDSIILRRIGSHDIVDREAKV
ncbi:MAG: hypothetical protein ACT4P5_06670 [Armatimonadota bacterium]